MISGVTVQIGGTSETFRLTTRAMMALEDIQGVGIVEVIEKFQGNLRIGMLAQIVAECANDGQGRDIAWAQGAIDILGILKVGDLIGQVAEVAFPETGKNENPKKAVRPK